LASDFDGTLSRPVTDPWRAGIIPSAQRALRRLAVAPETHVALISGRTVSDLARRARVGGASYHGDHGAEWALAARGFRPAALRSEHEPVDPAAAAMAARVRAEVPRRIDEPWLVVEDKGPAVTFHFRAAPDTDAARARVRAAVDAIDREHLLDQPGGRRAWELRPRGATTKGLALARLIADHQPGLVLMLGDDHHDAEAFDAVRAACRSAGREGLTVAVVSPAADVAEMARRADVLFDRADVTARFLTLLARERAARR
jgi:trehalose 6-phosphate phosphatase